jgi:WD40 repeat protein
VSSYRQRAVTSADGAYVAVVFTGGIYFMGQGDSTPAHVRVWDARTGKLQVWWPDRLSIRQEGEQSIAFLSDSESLLYAGSDGLEVINCRSRESERLLPNTEPLLWLPNRGQILCKTRNGVILLDVAGYGSQANGGNAP